MVADGDQTNFRPQFKDEGTTVPCEGKVGDIFVYSGTFPDEFDDERLGHGSFWLCTRSSDREGHAVWRRIAFDGFATCDTPMLADPPKDVPELRGG